MDRTQARVQLQLAHVVQQMMFLRIPVPDNHTSARSTIVVAFPQARNCAAFKPSPNPFRDVLHNQTGASGSVHDGRVFERFQELDSRRTNSIRMDLDSGHCMGGTLA